jgi:transcriptional regulator with XRE-family HTH domain
MERDMNSAEMKGFAKRLNDTAHRAGIYRPTNLAKMSGLSAVTVAAYMRGTRGASLHACYALAEALKVNPVWLYCGHEKLTDAKDIASTKPSHKSLMAAAERAHDLGMTMLQLSSKLTMMSNNI